MSLTKEPNPPSKAGFLPTWMTRGALGIVLATFFSDVGHEMVTAVLPLYLTSIGLRPAALGIMESRRARIAASP